MKGGNKMGFTKFVDGTTKYFGGLYSSAKSQAEETIKSAGYIANNLSVDNLLDKEFYTGSWEEMKKITERSVDVILNKKKDSEDEFNNANQLDYSSIFGKPYRGAPHVDVPTHDDNYSYDYANDIDLYSNLVSFSPCIAKLNINLDSRVALIRSYLKDGNLTDEEFSELFKDSKVGQGLLSLENDNVNFSFEVYGLCKLVLILMGIDLDNDKEAQEIIKSSDITGKNLIRDGDFFDVPNTAWVSRNVTKVASKYLEVDDGYFLRNRWYTFYNNGGIDTSEGINNNVGQGQLANLLGTNMASQLGGELSFLMGGTGIGQDASGKLDFKDGLWSSIFSTVKNIGIAKFSLPEIWQGSSTDRVFNLKFRFITPYGNNYSRFKNCILPICHIIALATPRALINDGISYSCPRIVKFYAPGNANVRLGMITNFAIVKDPADIGVDKACNTYDVSVTLKDLDPMFMLPPLTEGMWNTRTKNSPIHFLNAKGLGEYLGMIAGINISELDDALLTKLRKEQAIDKILTAFRETVLGLPRRAANATLMFVRANKSIVLGARQ